MKTVYADNAATTALCPEALDAMVDCLKNNYGNASSLHHMGQEAAAAVLQARRDIADAIGADVNEIYFTSSFSTIGSSACKVFTSMRCWMVSCKTLCT